MTAVVLMCVSLSGALILASIAGARAAREREKLARRITTLEGRLAEMTDVYSYVDAKVAEIVLTPEDRKALGLPAAGEFARLAESHRESIARHKAWRDEIRKQNREIIELKRELRDARS